MKNRRLAALASTLLALAIPVTAAGQQQREAPPSVSQLEAAVARTPEDPQAHVALGLAYWGRNEYPRALQEFRRAVEVGPRSAEAHNWLGVALSGKSDLPGAVAEFRKAVELDPKYGRAYTNLGSALATSGGIYGYTSGILTTPEDYDQMVAAVQTLMGQLGRPLVGSELPNDYSTLVKDFPKAADGSLLTLVYPGSVALSSAESAAVVRASWIGVHWGRSEHKPNVVYYGFTPYLVAGGFTITGDISAVARTVLGQN